MSNNSSVLPGRDAGRFDDGMMARRGHHLASEAGAGATIRGSDPATESAGGDADPGVSRASSTPGADHVNSRPMCTTGLRLMGTTFS